MLFHRFCERCCLQQHSWLPWVPCLRQQQGWHDPVNKQQGHRTGHCGSPERRHRLRWRHSNRSYQRDHHNRTTASNPLVFTPSSTPSSINATNAASSPTSTPNNAGTTSSPTGAHQFSQWDWWHSGPSGKLGSNGHHYLNSVGRPNCRDTTDFDNSVSVQWRSLRTGSIGRLCAVGGKHNCSRRRHWEGITGWTSWHSGFRAFRDEQSDDNGDHNHD